MKRAQATRLYSYAPGRPKGQLRIYPLLGRAVTEYRDRQCRETGCWVRPARGHEWERHLAHAVEANTVSWLANAYQCVLQEQL